MHQFPVCMVTTVVIFILMFVAVVPRRLPAEKEMRSVMCHECVVCRRCDCQMSQFQLVVEIGGRLRSSRTGAYGRKPGLLEVKWSFWSACQEGVQGPGGKIVGVLNHFLDGLVSGSIYLGGLVTIGGHDSSFLGRRAGLSRAWCLFKQSVFCMGVGYGPYALMSHWNASEGQDHWNAPQEVTCPWILF